MIFFISQTTTETIFYGFCLFQMVLVLFFIPLLSGSRINMEYEQDTWDLLYTTHITGASILLGKTLSSFLYMWLLLVAFSPIYGLIILLGGVSPMEALGFLTAISEVILIATLIGLLCSAWFQKTVTSITAAYIGVYFYFFILPFALLNVFLYFMSNSQYLMVQLLCSLLSPFLLIGLLRDAGPGLSGYSIPQLLFYHFGIMLVVMLALSFSCLWFIRRRNRLETSRVLRQIAESKPFTKDILYTPKPIVFSESTDPVYSKEVHLYRTRNRYKNFFIFLSGFLISAFILNLVFLEMMLSRNTHLFQLNLFILMWPAVFNPLITVPVAVHCMRMEKDRDTLDLLRTINLSDVDIVWGKFMACLRIYTPRFLAFYGTLFGGSIIILLCDFLFSSQLLWSKNIGMIFFLLLLSPLILYAWSVFYISIGFYFSVTSRQTTATYLKTLFVSFFLLIGPVIVHFLVNSLYQVEEMNALLGCLSPLLLLYNNMDTINVFWWNVGLQFGAVLIGSMFFLCWTINHLRRQE